jgi:hypothetical protein
MQGRHHATPDLLAQYARQSIVGLAATIFGLLLAVLSAAPTALAATITVTNNLDPATAATTGVGVSLREAILSINQGSNFDADVVADISTDPTALTTRFGSTSAEAESG